MDGSTTLQRLHRLHELLLSPIPSHCKGDPNASLAFQCIEKILSEANKPGLRPWVISRVYAAALPVFLGYSTLQKGANVINHIVIFVTNSPHHKCQASKELSDLIRLIISTVPIVFLWPFAIVYPTIYQPILSRQEEKGEGIAAELATARATLAKEQARITELEERAAELATAKARSDDELAAARATLAKEQVKIAKLEERAAELATTKASLAKEQAKIAKLEERAAELTTTKASLAKEQARIAELEETLEKKQTRIAALEETLEEQQGVLDEIARGADKLDKDDAEFPPTGERNLAVPIEQKDSGAASVNEQLQGLRELLRTKEEALAAAIEQKDSDIAKAKARLAEQKDAEVANAKARLEKQQAIIATLKEAAAEFEAAGARSDAELATARASLGEQRARIAALEGTAAEFEAAIERSDAELVTAVAMLREQRARSAALEKTAAEFEAAIERSDAELVTAVATLREQRARSAALEKTAAELEAAIARSDAELERSAAELATARATLAEQQARIAELEERAAELATAKARSDDELVAARATLEKKQKDSDTASVNEQLRGLREQLQASEEALAAAIEQKDSDTASVNEELRGLRELLRTKEEALAAAKQQKDSDAARVNEQLRGLREQLQASEEALAAAKQQKDTEVEEIRWEHDTLQVQLQASEEALAAAKQQKEAEVARVNEELRGLRELLRTKEEALAAAIEQEETEVARITRERDESRAQLALLRTSRINRKNAHKAQIDPNLGIRFLVTKGNSKALIPDSYGINKTWGMVANNDETEYNRLKHSSDESPYRTPFEKLSSDPSYVDIKEVDLKFLDPEGMLTIAIEYKKEKIPFLFMAKQHEVERVTLEKFPIECLWGTSGDHSFLESLKIFTKIHTLQLKDCTFTKDQLVTIAKLFPNITCFIIEGARNQGAEDEVYEALRESHIIVLGNKNNLTDQVNNLNRKLFNLVKTYQPNISTNEENKFIENFFKEKEGKRFSPAAPFMRNISFLGGVPVKDWALKKILPRLKACFPNMKVLNLSKCQELSVFSLRHLGELDLDALSMDDCPLIGYQKVGFEATSSNGIQNLKIQELDYQSKQPPFISVQKTLLELSKDETTAKLHYKHVPELLNSCITNLYEKQIRIIQVKRVSIVEVDIVAALSNISIKPPVDSLLIFHKPNGEDQFTCVDKCQMT